MKRRDEVIVGVFVTVAVVIGVVGTLWLARRGFSKSYPMYAQFEWGNNLKTGQPVELAGVQIGSVETVTLNPAGYLDVEMEIDKQWKIPEGTSATVQNEGFFGDKSIALHPCRRPQSTVGAEGAAAIPASRDSTPVCRPNAFLPQGDTIPTGRPAPSMDELLGRVDSMSTQMSLIVHSLQVELVQKNGIQDIHQTIQSTNALLVELHRVAAQQSEALSMTLASIRRSAAALDSAALDTTVHNVAATTRNLQAMTADLQRTSSRLDSVITQVQHGDGTVSKFLNDPGVYNELRTLLARMDSLTADVKANPKKYFNVKVF
ncbi:MAG TPA: MlaD family protein [Gemmatimonadaceae bacterium]|nr:MlaD family protein [Gemmatimonadaceae bacterium]